MRYRSSSVFSLGQWTAHLPTGLACPGVLLVSQPSLAFIYGAFTLSDGPFQNLRLATAGLLLTGCSAFARHYSQNDLFSSGYLDVSVPPVPLRLAMCSPGHAQACPCAGFPIRTPPVHTGAHPSPELFAVYRVLHRHLTPRHSPYALVA